MSGIDISRVRFLIVDDNPFMRALLRQILRAFNVTHIADATDGAEALSAMKDFLPDIVLLDWEMAPMDGLAFCRAVRADDNSPNPYVPIIMITAHSDVGRVTMARDAGVNEILVKPVAAKQLFQRIRAVVERPRLYVSADEYFGPDRRRRADPDFKGDERRGGDNDNEGPAWTEPPVTADSSSVSAA